MAGRKPLISKETVDEVFAKEFAYIVSENKVVQPSSEIWQSIKIKYAWAKMDTKAIYERARQWKKEKDRDETVNHSAPNNSMSDRSEQSVSDQSMSVDLSDLNINFNESTSNSDRNVKKRGLKKFKITLSYDVWRTISPITKNYKRELEQSRNKRIRVFKVLPPGVWTNVVSEHIVQNSTAKQLNCCWKFIRAKVYSKGKVFVRIFGGCTVCSASLSGVIRKKPARNEPVDICFTAENVKEHIERPKRRLNGARAKKIFQSKEKAGCQKRKEAESMEMFEREPITSSTANSIYCGQYRHRKSQRLSDEPMRALSYLKASPSYEAAISMIGYNPFFVHYTTPDQFCMFNEYTKRKTRTQLCCDATGGLVKKIERPADSSGPIFLYSLVIYDTFQISVGSMLSENHTSNAIMMWLSEWLRNGGDTPDEFVCDMSLAILNAAVRTFAQLSSVKEYNDTCFELCKRNVAATRISCYIRIDIAHLMKSISCWKSFQNASAKVKEFYMRSVGLIIKSRTLKEVEKCIVAIFIVSLSATEGFTDGGRPTPCEKEKVFLKNRIGSDDFLESFETSNENDEVQIENEEDDNDFGGSPIKVWIDDMKIKAQNIVKDNDIGNRDNLMCNKSILDELGRLCLKIPMWGGFCSTIFSSPHVTASSAYVESYFSDLKRSLRDQVPCSVDQFVKIHIDFTNGASKIASSKYAEQDNIVRSNSEESLNVNDNLSVPTRQTSEKNTTSCVACNNGDFPTGAHVCERCYSAVHILDGCSIPAGEDVDEGHGDRRICSRCSKSTDAERIKEMGAKENWRDELAQGKKVKKVKKSKYLSPAPLWTIDSIDAQPTKQIKMGLLRNGNKKTKYIKVMGIMVALANTAAFDAVAQNLAGIYAHNDSYRHVIEGSEEDIFSLAVLLAKKLVFPFHPFITLIRLLIRLNYFQCEYEQNKSYASKCVVQGVRNIL